MKVVINKCFGGFSLSTAAVEEIGRRKGEEVFFFPVRGSFLSVAYKVPNPEAYRLDERDADGTCKEANELAKSIKPTIGARTKNRADTDLVAVVEEMGCAAYGSRAVLKVVEIPDDVEYTIEERSGYEHIAEAHRIWQ